MLCCRTDIPSVNAMIHPTSTSLRLSVKITFVPGDASGDRLKSNAPLKYTHADNSGFIQHVHNKFNVISHCYNIISHSLTGDLGSHVANPTSR